MVWQKCRFFIRFTKVHSSLSFYTPVKTFHHRSEGAYQYFRDTVAKDVQKFNEALRTVYVSEPTGVSEQEKINMAVAIHKKLTNAMNYTLKDYDPNKWRNYMGWLHLKEAPKFRYSTRTMAPYP
jgi:hypothetical protein